jgi:hypothetical protein
VDVSTAVGVLVAVPVAVLVAVAVVVAVGPAVRVTVAVLVRVGVSVRLAAAAACTGRRRSSRAATISRVRVSIMAAGTASGWGNRLRRLLAERALLGGIVNLTVADGDGQRIVRPIAGIRLGSWCL